MEKEKNAALKKLDASEREREYQGNFLICLFENIKRFNEGLKNIAEAQSGELNSEHLEDLRKKQLEMDEIVSATSSFLASLPEQLPSMASLPSFSSVADFVGSSGSSGSIPTRISSTQLPIPPPEAPPAPAQPPPPPLPAPVPAQSEPAKKKTTPTPDSRGAVLAQIRMGSFDLKKVERRPPGITHISSSFGLCPD